MPSPSQQLTRLLREDDGPWGRGLRRLHLEFMDHGVLRHFWTNRAQVAPGVWRGNQPPPWRLAQMKAAGFRSIVTLRGTPNRPPQRIEAEACARLGLAFHATALQARAPCSREGLLQLFTIFRTAEKPLYLHCKSGADRAGLAAALYLIGIEGRSVAEARAQLSLRFLHLKSSKTGICDHFLDVFEQRQAETGIDLATWIATEYDPVALARGFRA